MAVATWQAQQRRAFVLGLMPALLVLAAVTVGPAIYLLVTSLTPMTPLNPGSGLDFSNPLGNYRQALFESSFLHSVGLQVELSAITVGLQTLTGLGLALLLNINSRFAEAVRTGFLIPMVLPPIVVAIVWKILYTPNISPLYAVFSFIGLPLGSLITEPATALPAIAVADTWEWFPFTFLMLLSALQMIPPELLEAGCIDGAGAWQMFRHIRLPFLRPVLGVAVLFRLIDSIKAFPLIYVLTNGGPGQATEVTNYYAFIQTFNFTYWGYGSAIATLMVIGVFLLSLVVNRVSGRADD
ncbi:MAG TPA: sugar ABC transporter permease [Bradyrhizobium sp.]|uniref:carbohydrate ABC transporter permease n=1 Tax=Bradyrhizobium sp. TaxID=376 RepID=UPI002C67D847|nr:sugar ABC transporter permease [Bradyrhizobium sp.]HLZ02789.1 sugar ABC transporter permease [Bradyrhizobium sp.]